MKKSKDTERVKHKKWRKELPEMAEAFLPHNLWRELPQFIKAIFVFCVLALVVLAGFLAFGIIMTDRALSIEMVMIAILIAVAAVLCGVVATFYAVGRVASMGVSIAQLSAANERLTIALRKANGLEFLDEFEPNPLFHDDVGMEFAFLNQNIAQEVDDNDFLEVAIAQEPEPVVPETARVEAAKAEEQGAERQVEAPLQPTLEEQPIVAEEPADDTKEYEIKHAYPLPEGITQLVPTGITQKLPMGAINTAISGQIEPNRVEQHSDNQLQVDNQPDNQAEQQFELEPSSVRAQADELGVMFNTLWAKLIKNQVPHYSQLPDRELFSLRKTSRIAG